MFAHCDNNSRSLFFSTSMSDPTKIHGSFSFPFLVKSSENRLIQRLVLTDTLRYLWFKGPRNNPSSLLGLFCISAEAWAVFLFRTLMRR